MADQRTPRDKESRKASNRKSDSWIPESQLPMPNPRPGWVFKYIRISTLGKDDARNVSKRFREGWAAVVASEYPELDFVNDVNSRWPEGVEIGGLLLCKMPAKKAKERNEYYARLATQQLESVNAGYMNDQHASMPKHNESSSRTSFGKG